MAAVIPSKLLSLILTTLTEVDWWTADDGTGDPWIGSPYRWQITAAVQVQPHSSHQTREPYQYNGLDLKVGDWLANMSGGRALRIVSFSSQTAEEVTFIAEDVDRYNQFNDRDGNGAGGLTEGEAFAFEVSEDGTPILIGVPPNILSASFQSDLAARFSHRNIFRKYISVNQPSHGMNVGDPIYLDGTGVYFKSSANADAARMIGIVTSTNTPGVDWFSFRPIGEVVRNISPPLPGQQGDVIYLGVTPGTFTATRPISNAKPVFIQMDAAGSMGVLLQQGISVEPSTVKSYTIPEDQMTGQPTTFILPADAMSIIELAVNGIELRQGVEYEYNPTLKQITIFVVEIGYEIEPDDEIIIQYKT